MTRRDWEKRLPEGVRLESRDKDGFRLGIPMPVGDDGLWPLRCPQHPEDHIFKVPVTQNEPNTSSPLYCPYCGHREDDVWAFAPEQRERALAAAAAAAEQYGAAEISDMLAKAFGGRPHRSSRRSGFDVSYKPGRPPSRRALPTFEIDETRRIMECQLCEESFTVYGLAIYCPNCGQMAPAQQFGELLRVQQERLAAQDDVPAEHKRALVESGVLTANYESTIKDGLTALETYLKVRFVSDAPMVSLAGKGAVFQRLDEAADLYRDHLGIDLRGAFAGDAWRHLLRVSATRHVLVHNAGVVDAKFLEREPAWPQSLGQRLQVSKDDASRFLLVLSQLVSAIGFD